MIDPSVSKLESTLGTPTIRHVNCQWPISGESTCIRCTVCVQHRSVLMVQSHRAHNVSTDTSHSSHVNYKYVCTLPSLDNNYYHVY